MSRSNSLYEHLLLSQAVFVIVTGACGESLWYLAKMGVGRTAIWVAVAFFRLLLTPG